MKPLQIRPQHLRMCPTDVREGQPVGLCLENLSRSEDRENPTDTEKSQNNAAQAFSQGVTERSISAFF